MRVNYKVFLVKLRELGVQKISDTAGYTVLTEIRALPQSKLPNNTVGLTQVIHQSEQAFLSHIAYDKDLPPQQRLFVLAHEFGHAIDFIGIDTLGAAEIIFIHKSEGKGRICAGIAFEVEKRAWVHAELLLKEIGVSDNALRRLQTFREKALMYHLAAWEKRHKSSEKP